jgi:hypothetical protein
MKRRNGDAVLSQRIPGGVMHEMPADLRTALIAAESSDESRCSLLS